MIEVAGKTIKTREQAIKFIEEATKYVGYNSNAYADNGVYGTGMTLEECEDQIVEAELLTFDEAVRIEVKAYTEIHFRYELKNRLYWCERLKERVRSLRKKREGNPQYDKCYKGVCNDLKTAENKACETIAKLFNIGIVDATDMFISKYDQLLERLEIKTLTKCRKAGHQQEAYFLRFDGKKYFFEGIPFDTRRLGYIIKSGTREEIEKYIKDEHFEVLQYTLSQKTESAEREDA